MDDSFKLRVLASLQHAFCYGHYRNFTLDFWREFETLFAIERNCSESTRLMLNRVFPEAPKVCTPDCWIEYKEWVTDGGCSLEMTRVGHEIADGALQIFGDCAECRMWSERQVIASQEEKATLLELDVANNELDIRCDLWSNRYGKLKDKHRESRRIIKYLLGEVERLQFMLSNAHIPNEILSMHGPVYNPKINEDEIMKTCESSGLIRYESEGEHNPPPPLDYPPGFPNPAM